MAGREKRSKRFPNQDVPAPHSGRRGTSIGPAADLPINEPRALDKALTVEPGLFLGIKTKPPAHQRQLRLLKEKIEDIYKVHNQKRIHVR